MTVQNRIIVNPNGGTVAVTITPAVLDGASGSAVSFPASISTTTTYWAGNGTYTVTGTICGVSVLSETVRVSGSSVQTVTASVPRVDQAGFIPVCTNAGTPEAAVTADKGALCTDTTNGVLYVKHTGSGNTGWQAVTAS